MKTKIITIITLLILLSSISFSQDEAKKEAAEKERLLKEKAAKMLLETRDEINTLRTIENRISFSSELADLFWYHDAAEGKRMFSNITDDFTEIMSRYNAEINSYGGVKNKSEFYRGMFSPDDKSRVIAKMTKAIGVRQQIALSIARHDAEIGSEFVERTSSIITDKNFREMLEKQNVNLESAMISFMAEQDIDKALILARKKLKKNFRNSMLNLLDKVNAKDKSKAESFATEILNKVKSDLRVPKKSFRDTFEVLKFGRKHIDKLKGQSGKKPIFSKNSMSSLANDFSNALITRSGDAQGDYRLDSYYSTIKEFSPSSARRLQQKYKDSITDDSVGTPKSGVGFIEEKAESAIDVSGNLSREAKKENRKKEIFEKIKGEGFKKLPKEERQKIIDEAQSIVTAFKNPTEKIASLSILAATVKQLGDDKLASELMNEASLLVNPQPKTYLDYMQIWSLVTGYSEVDAEKTFPILENTIYQLNDTLEAFVKVGEFIDVGGNLVIDNEVQLGSFGGAMTQGFIGQIGSYEGVIKNLAAADFNKTKELAESFGRTELRIFVKMMIMRSVLDDGKNKLSNEQMRNLRFLF